MGGSDDLENKLRRLVAERAAPDPEGRLLTGDDPFAAIVGEIDETVLPRRLTFSAGSGRTLVLDASSRRLRSIVDAADAALGGRALTRDDAVAAARRLADFAGDSGTLRVRQDPAKDEFSASGISAARLIEAAAEAGAPPTPEEVFRLSAAHAEAGVLYRPDTAPVEVGQAELLIAVAGDALSATRGVRRAAGPLAIAILGVAGGRQLVVANAKGVEVVLLTEAGGAEAIAAMWRRLDD